MDRLTVRKNGMVMLVEDGIFGNKNYIPPICMNGQQTKRVLERLAELEDAIEQGKLVRVSLCKDCGLSCELTTDEKKLHVEDTVYCRYFEEVVYKYDYCSNWRVMKYKNRGKRK